MHYKKANIKVQRRDANVFAKECLQVSGVNKESKNLLRERTDNLRVYCGIFMLGFTKSMSTLFDLDSSS